jgi:hypothetical protein
MRCFTEQGVAMLAGVLRSEQAVAMSIAIIRAFVQLRELLATHEELAAKLCELESKLEGHDSAIANLFEAIRQLLAPAEPDHDRNRLSSRESVRLGQRPTWPKKK